MESHHQQCDQCPRKNCFGPANHQIQRQFPTAGDLVDSKQFEYNIPNCRTCGVELLDLLEQLEMINLRNKICCVICGYHYAYSSEHLTHFPMHFNSASTSPINLQCIECTPNADHIMLACHFCPKTFKFARSKRKHLNKYHSKELLYPCALCNLRFVSPTDVKGHVKRMHRDRTEGRRASLGLFPCRICPVHLRFDSADARNEHDKEMHIDNETGKYICPICKQLYINHFKVVDHMRVHKEPDFVCDLCGKNFVRRFSLKLHIRSVHATNFDFVCDKCPNKKFKTERYLQIHTRAQHSDNPYRYPCELCDRIFNSSTDRRRHRWTHGGFPTPHSCLVCDKAFHEKKQLRMHMKSHGSHTQII